MQDSSSLRSYGSQLSFGSGGGGGGSGYGSYRTGRSSVSGPSYGGAYDSYRSRAASTDRSLAFVSQNKGNVSSLMERFKPSTSSYGGGSSYGSRDYDTRSGYSSDVGGASTRSYGSYRSGTSYSSRDSSPPRSTTSSRPSRVDYSRSSSRDYGSSSKDYGASYTRSTSKDYGSAAGSTKDLGSSYGSSYSKGSTSASRAKTADLNLTPFSTRRSKTSDVNLTPFTSRLSRQSSVEPVTKQERERKDSGSTSSTAKESKQSSSRSKSERKSSSRADDESSDSAEEPEGGSKDPTIKYATSRGTLPMEPDYEMYEELKAGNKKRRERRKTISRTKTKIFPVKVYRRKWERPKMLHRDVQVNTSDLDRFCGRKTTTRTAEVDLERQKSRQARMDRRSKFAEVMEKKPPEKPKDSVVSERKARWEQMPQTKEAPKSTSLPRQSGFKPTSRRPVSRDEEEEEDTVQEEDTVNETEDDTSTFEKEPPYIPPQTPYRPSSAKERRKERQNNKPKVMPLTPENLSLKDSIEKVKNWKKQLSLVPPETEEIVRDAERRKREESQRMNRQHTDSTYSTEDYSEQDDETFGEPKIYGKDEYERYKDKLSKKPRPNRSGGLNRNKEPPKTSKNDVKSPPGSKRGSKAGVVSPPESEQGFLREESPNTETRGKKHGKKLFAGMQQFPVDTEESEVDLLVAPKSKSKSKKGAPAQNDRSPSPYDNVHRGNRFQRQRVQESEDDDDYQSIERSPSPYDNLSGGRKAPAIVIDRVQSLDRGHGQSVDSLADFADDSSLGDTDTDTMSRAQSMMSLDTNQSNSLPRRNHLIPKALSLDCLSMGTSTSSLPDLVQSSEGARRQGLICQVKDIDSLLGFTETEDDFSDEFTEDYDTDYSLAASERSMNRRNQARQGGAADKDSIILSPVKEENHFAEDSEDDLHFCSRTPVEEIVYIGDCTNIDDVLDGPVNGSQTGSHSLKLHDRDSMHLGVAQQDQSPSPAGTQDSCDSILDTPVPDTPDVPLIPSAGYASTGSAFQFPPAPKRTQSEEHINKVGKTSSSNKAKKSGRVGKAQSMANLDDLDQLLDTISVSKKKQVKRKDDSKDPFELFSASAKTDLRKDTTPAVVKSSGPVLTSFDLVDSAKVAHQNGVPTGKLIDLSSESGSSTPRRGSPSVRRYPPNYSDEAVKKAMEFQKKHGKISMSQLMKICSRKRAVKPPWIADDEERNFKGFRDITQLIEDMGVDSKKVR